VRVGGHDFDGFVDQMGRMIKGLKDADDEGQKAAPRSPTSASRRRICRAISATRRRSSRISRSSSPSTGRAATRWRWSRTRSARAPSATCRSQGPRREDRLPRHATARQAAAAEEANKAINRLKLTFEDARKELVIGLTPAIQAAGPLGRFFKKPLGSSYAGTESDLKKRLEFLRYQQRQAAAEAAAGTGEAFMDSTDIALAGGRGQDKLGYLTQDPRRLTPAQIAAKQLEGMEELKRQEDEYTVYISKQEHERFDIRMKAIQEELEQEATVQRARVYGTTDESAENQDPERLAHTERLQMLREQFKSEEQVANEHYNTRRATLAEFSREELDAVGGRQEAERRLEQDHALELYQIRKSSLDRIGALNRLSWQGQTQTVLTEIISMTAGVATHSKAMFQLNKAAALANAAIKLPESVMNAYEFGTEFGGPYLGAAMAAIAFAAQTANIAQIASASFGSGVAPSIGSTAAPPVMPVPAQAAAPASAQTTIVDFQGTSDERKLLRRFVELLNESSRDGGRIVLAS
jgi:hypothetical protein